MEPIQFNILKKAHDNTKINNRLNLFFKEHGVEIAQVKKNPEYYKELIMKYSRECINQELFEQSREIMEKEFNRVCDFHRKNEEELVEKFYRVTKDIIKKEEI